MGICESVCGDNHCPQMKEELATSGGFFSINNIF